MRPHAAAECFLGRSRVNGSLQYDTDSSTACRTHNLGIFLSKNKGKGSASRERLPWRNRLPGLTRVNSPHEQSIQTVHPWLDMVSYVASSRV